MPWSLLAAYVPAVLAVFVILTWVYNATGGSWFAAVLMHGAMDASWGYVKRDLFAGIETGGSPREDWIAGAIFGVVAAGLVLRYGAANLSPRVCRPRRGSHQRQTRRNVNEYPDRFATSRSTAPKWYVGR